MKTNQLYIAAIIVGIVFMGATNLLGTKAKRRIIKYIPSGIAGIAAIVLYLKAFYFSEGFEGIAWFVFMVVMAAVCAASLITAVVIGFINKRKETEG